MKKYKKLLILGIFLLVLTGCTKYIDPKTGKIIEETIISLDQSWSHAWSIEKSWFGPIFVWPLAQALNFFELYVGAFGSIVVVSVLIKLATIRSSIKSTVQQQKMQLLGPEQARIDAKYKGRDDQQAKMQKATEIQALYKKHDINPLGSMGALLLQFPIMIAMYQAVARASNIIYGSFLGETLTGTPQQGLTEGNIVYIGIFVVMAFAQFLSMWVPQHLAKRKMKTRPNEKKPETPGQSMMYVSLIMIVGLGFTWPIGMSLYWLVTSIVTILQALLIEWKYTDK